jgi:DtxR family transcriptional regulator, Mn-dependent transcriptional regulator
MITKAIEDYLKAIYQVEVDRGAVSTNALADRLSLTAASVTGMLKKLAALDLVTYTPYQGVSLTEEGRAIALRMVRHHRLAERYLTEVLGMEWDEVHAEAEEWEHAMSDRVARKLDLALGGPATDPHGEPIPTASGAITERQDVTLSALPAGESAVISRVYSHDAALLRYLGRLGLYPGVTLTVVEVAPFGGPVTLAVAGAQYSIGRPVAEHVFVDWETRET